MNPDGNVVVNWDFVASTHPAGITSYNVEVLKADGTWQIDEVSCPQGGDATFLAARTCTFNMDRLQDAPYNLVSGNTV